MPLTAAEKMKWRRQKLKDEGRYEDYKKKHREVVKKYRERKKELLQHLSQRTQNKIAAEN